MRTQWLFCRRNDTRRGSEEKKKGDCKQAGQGDDRSSRGVSFVLCFVFGCSVKTHFVGSVHYNSGRHYAETIQDLNAMAYHLASHPETVPSYQLRLYPLSLERSALLASLACQERYELDCVQTAYEEERERVEEEWKRGRERIKERLVEGIEERRRRAREEKDGEGTGPGTSHLLFTTHNRITQNFTVRGHPRRTVASTHNAQTTQQTRRGRHFPTTNASARRRHRTRRDIIHRARPDHDRSIPKSPLAIRGRAAISVPASLDLIPSDHWHQHKRDRQPPSRERRRTRGAVSWWSREEFAAPRLV